MLSVHHCIVPHKWALCRPLVVVVNDVLDGRKLPPTASFFLFLLLLFGCLFLSMAPCCLGLRCRSLPCGRLRGPPPRCSLGCIRADGSTAGAIPAARCGGTDLLTTSVLASEGVGLKSLRRFFGAKLFLPFSSLSCPTYSSNQGACAGTLEGSS